MTPSRLDLEVYAGDQNRMDLEILADGDPVDLTGATIVAQCRKAVLDTVVGMTATIVDIAPSIGQVSVLWDGEQVRTLMAGADTWTGVWDLQIREAGEILPVTPVAGTWVAKMDVTRLP